MVRELNTPFLSIDKISRQKLRYAGTKEYHDSNGLNI
jgi:hypothetical protein